MTDPDPTAVISARFQSVWEEFLSKIYYDVEPPPIIYHYTNAAGLLGIVNSTRIWASDVLFMNDSTEVQYGRAVIVSEADDASNSSKSPLAKRLLRDFDTILDRPESMVGHFYAACFCEDGDLLSQWRGYSGGTVGYALGVFTEELGARPGSGKPTPEQHFYRRRVIYEPAQQRELVRGFIEGMARVLEGVEDSPLARYETVISQQAHRWMLSLLLDCMVILKNPAFKEEKEWRLVQDRSFFEAGASPPKYRPARSFLVPYVSLDISPSRGVHADRIPLARVVVGPTPHPEVAVASVRAVLADKNPSAEVVNSTVPLRV